MTVATLDTRPGSLMRTDSGRIGCGVETHGSMAGLTTEVTTAIDRAIWSFTLQADFEDEFDTALFRAAIVETPTLTGNELLAFD